VTEVKNIKRRMVSGREYPGRVVTGRRMSRHRHVVDVNVLLRPFTIFTVFTADWVMVAQQRLMTGEDLKQILSLLLCITHMYDDM